MLGPMVVPTAMKKELFVERREEEVEKDYAPRRMLKADCGRLVRKLTMIKGRPR
jgi:hypothetical protein